MTDSLAEPFGAWEYFEEKWERFAKNGHPSHTNALPVPVQVESDFVDRLKLCADLKDNSKAADARAQGNALFHPKVKRYIEALKRYNESILFSEKGSEARALAYANRSAICYELRRYKECLENIRLARESNYPSQLMEKLNKREQSARVALQGNVINNAPASIERETEKTKHENASELSLTYEESELAPQAANCLELQTSKEFGRFVATTRDLKVGDVVMIEKPFCSLLLDTYRLIRCDFCHQERMLTLIPCEGCTVAMYCTEECMMNAFNRYHRYECPVIRDMWRIFTQIPMMAMRTVIAGIASFEHDLSSMKKHLEELDESKVNGFTMDWKTATPRDIYDTVHVLITNANVRNAKDKVHRIFFTQLMLALLLERSELNAMCKSDPEISLLLFELILRHMQTSPANMHSLYCMEYIPEEKGYDLANYASACFPLLSMINHSCAPNLTRVTLRDGRCAIVIIRPIPKGGQLYDSYGQHHCLTPIRERRSNLLAQYKFLCQCEACVNDYPLYAKLPSIDIQRYGLIDTVEIHAELVQHEPKIAAELMPKLCRYLNDMGYQYPRGEVSSCQELFLRCFQILHMETSDIRELYNYCNP